MSRLHEIVENHQQLEQLNALLKHYSVNAQYVTSSLIKSFEDEEEKNEDLLTDLKQLFFIS
ncbi:hypothetical protein [Paenibacillus sp. YYML68]|uniref:hypothetical protein n=1 Tax=Paenibacillus sp. YYML68 TaxID=2909250 RepID=UPI00248FF3E3|nr:hypothetical protein [Paenibacillus sp. YYML68]